MAEQLRPQDRAAHTFPRMFGETFMPAMVADLLGYPALTHVRELTVSGSTVTGRRETDDGVTVLTAELPAVVSVSEKINEPRYPSFKGIMAAKKKPVETLSLADAGIDPGQVGLGAAATEVVSFAKRPPRQAGTVVKDDGDGGVKAAEFLASQKFI